MRKFDWFYEITFATSLISFRGFLFVYPQVLIQFFFDRSAIVFYVSDLNLFTYWHTYNICFFTYLLYAPFFYFRCFCYRHKRVSAERYLTRIRTVSLIGYSHVYTLFCNHFDFTNRYIQVFLSFFESQVKGIDFSYILMQYSGSFWDFFVCMAIFHIALVFFRDNHFIFKRILYEISNITAFSFSIKNSVTFWSQFKFLVIFRISIACFALYFFCGDGVLSDLLTLILTLVSIEYTLFSFRVCSFLKAFNGVLIHLSSYLPLVNIFSYLFKAIMK